MTAAERAGLTAEEVKNQESFERSMGWTPEQVAEIDARRTRAAAEGAAARARQLARFNESPMWATRPLGRVY